MGIKTCFKKSILAVMRWASNNEQEKADLGMEPSPYHSGYNSPNQKLQCGSVADIRANYPMTITVHHGQGGRVIMTSSFDRQAKDWAQSMYILHDEDELADELAKIISLESLR